MNAPVRLIGQSLLAAGLISEDQLRIALREQALHHRPLGRLLVDLGFLSDATLCAALSASLGERSVDLHETVPDAEALALVAQDFARRHRLLPLSFDAARPALTVAMADPRDVVALDRLRALLPAGTHLDTVLAADGALAQALDRHYGYRLAIDDIVHELESGDTARAAPPAFAAGASYGQPAVRLVDALLTDAVKRGASDLHFEPEAGFLRIRYRIDGLLRQIRAFHGRCWPPLAVRLKVLAGLDIADTRSPQDGRLSLTVGGRAVDFRVSVLPTLHGENIVLRVLDRQRGVVGLDALGLDAAQRQLLQRMLARPEGLILFTGPTGSGKTTTLYALLAHLNAEAVNIMTLEDPVEYPLPQVRQTSLGEASRLDFAGGVRALLRQDPDVILVGEIRDAETADMALRAAMTGHRVLSTLHTNSALGAIPRLLDIGIVPDVLAGNLTGVVAQRLVRRLCPACQRPTPASAHDRRLLGLAPEAEAPPLFVPGACPACDFQGYRGRAAVLEILRIDDELDRLIACRAPRHELQAAAHRAGLRTLADDGARRVLDGTTSLAELCRVVDLTERMDVHP